jgi:hypothetical protein
MVRVVEIDENELAVRLAMAIIGMRPPVEMSAEEAIEALETSWNVKKLGPFPFRLLALAASEYICGQLDRAGTLQ